MSDRPVRVVVARPPGRRPSPRREPVAASRSLALPERATPAAGLASSAQAMAAFLALLAAWRLPPARGWRMLTGLPQRPRELSAEQIVRVQHLAAIDDGMRLVRGDSVGEWMVAGNGAAVTSGQAPVDFLTRAGTAGFSALARQVGVWAAL